MGDFRAALSDRRRAAEALLREQRRFRIAAAAVAPAAGYHVSGVPGSDLCFGFRVGNDVLAALQVDVDAPRRIGHLLANHLQFKEQISLVNLSMVSLVDQRVLPFCRHRRGLRSALDVAVSSLCSEIIQIISFYSFPFFLLLQLTGAIT